jgi:hypothetical protein
MFQIGGNTFYNQKNKIPMKIPEFKRSGIRITTEFHGIPSGFPNQGCKWIGKAYLNGQKKIGNHKGIVDTIHPSTLVFALWMHNDNNAVHQEPEW